MRCEPYSINMVMKLYTSVYCTDSYLIIITVYLLYATTIYRNITSTMILFLLSFSCSLASLSLTSVSSANHDCPCHMLLLNTSASTVSASSMYALAECDILRRLPKICFGRLNPQAIFGLKHIISLIIYIYIYKCTYC